MKYKKLIPALCAVLLLSLFAACSAGGSTAASTTATRPDVSGKNISVVATVFPAYDWARQIIGDQSDRVALTLLLDKGADLHNYQPTVEDIYKISTCDLFIYIGGESDKWVPDALSQATNPNMKVLCLMDLLGSAAREEETLEGMEEHEHGEDHDDDHDHDDHDEDHEHEGPEYDEHIWLSLRNAKLLCEKIEAALEEIDPQGKDAYAANCRAYTEKLDALDKAYTEATEHAARKTLLFADRFPFLYLAKDYGLQCWAAFSGCSAESEASFETVNFLVNKVDELSLPCVMKIENSNTRLAETIISSSKAKNAKILELNSLQAVTAQQVGEGVTYLGVMEQNLEVLKEALSN
jgi:zinc transport system substrate-binding protein